MIKATKKELVINHMSRFKTQPNHLLNNGFSLIEVMVTVGIVIIITSIALPSLNGFLSQMRVDNEVTQIQRLLLTARNTAINEGRGIILCPLNAERTDCSGVNNWSGIIGVVSRGGGVAPPGGAAPNIVIKQKDAIQAGDSLTYPFESLTYSARGQLANAVRIGTFIYCPNSQPEHARGVEVIISGRSTLSTDRNNDGIEQLRDGTNIACP